MKHPSPTWTGRLPGKLWLPVLPTLVILALALALTGTTNAAPPSQATNAQTERLTPAEGPVCQGCHPQEFADWKGTTHANATLDPVFQEELSKSHNQQACLVCHTTGFDTGSGKFMSEGVSCEACHGSYKEGHPKAETMQLPLQSDTCRLCHSAAFEQWETSKHGANKIDCFDCHQAHTQGLRLENQQKLCAACHADEQTKLAHSIHGISGVDCVSCHMSPMMKQTGSQAGVTMAMSDHSFTVASDVCTRCHATSAHDKTTGSQVAMAASTATNTATAQAGDERIAELEAQVNGEQQRYNSLRNVAVIGLGLTAGIGGVLGLIVGIGGAALLGRRKEP